MANIVVIGASAGGVEALRTMIRPLPANLQAAIFVVMHISPLTPSVLPQILSSAGKMKATAAWDGERIERSRIYVAPPDRHMLIEPGRVRLTRGPRENRHRPAIDPLFRSAARAYGDRVIGIVMTGLLDDGSTGLHIIKSEGGVAIVQDPNEALFPSMPLSAMRTTDIDYILPTQAIAGKILEIVTDTWKETVPGRAKAIAKEPVGVEGERMRDEEDERKRGKPSTFSCPDCYGTLWEMQEGDLLRFRCRVGHAFSVESMRDGYSDSIEGALWSAVRILEESAALEQRLADQAIGRGDDVVAERFRDAAIGRTEQARTLRDMLLSKEKTGEVA